MDRMLVSLECESTHSLRKINRCFIESGRPFDENFRQHFLKMSTLRYFHRNEFLLFPHFQFQIIAKCQMPNIFDFALPIQFRLDSSFNTVLFERLDESRMQISSTANAPTHGNEIANNMPITSLSKYQFVCIGSNGSIKLIRFCCCFK